jgi:predicted RND superfamily exporter protein
MPAAPDLGRLALSITTRPWTVIFSVLALTLLAFIIVAMTRAEDGPWLTVDASVENLLPAQAQDRQVWERATSRFGDLDPVLFVVKMESVYTEAGLRRIDELHRRLARTSGVSSVFSLATAPNLLASDEDDIDVGSFTEQALRDPARIPQLRAELRANPLYARTLVADDDRSVAFILRLAENDDAKFLASGIEQRLRAAAELPGVERVAMTGNAVLRAATTDAIWSGLSLTVPLAFLAVVVLLALAFRSASVVLLAAINIGVALLMMWAVGALAGFRLNLVTAIAPPVVVAFGVMFSIHLVSEWLRQDVCQVPDRATQALRSVAVPLLLNGLTTAVGLGALAFSPLPAVREFAGLGVAGVLALTVLSLSFLPAMMLVAGCRGRQQVLPGVALAQTAARWLAGFDVRQRRPILIVAVLVLLAGLMAASKVTPGTAYVGGFAERAPVRQDFEFINTRFDGAAAIGVLVESSTEGALLEPQVAKTVDDFVVWLRQQPEVGAVTSYVDHVKVLDAALADSRPESLRYPESLQVARQLVLFGGADALRGLLDGAQSTALLQVRINVDTSREISALVSRMEARLEQWPVGLSAHVTGTPVLATRTVEGMASGQWLSVAVAVLVIFAVLYALFMSLPAALMAMLPNLIPVGVYFGLLGITGIGLNPATSLIACLVIGVAVDDTIHFLARFNQDARATGNESEAVASALATTLRPVTLTTLALCLSFLAFVASPLTSQVQFGLLAASALLLAWLTDLFVTPALGSMVRIVTLWDLLRVDLGQSPQYTIPLLAGLSNRQARVFALTANYEQVAEGTEIVREGDHARDIFVCVDGELEVWLERAGERRVLNRMGRGATIGEAGYFGQRRTANVTATSQSRLLRFDSQDLERLRRRHPRIAALVLRNLNRIQAERLAHATALLS